MKHPDPFSNMTSYYGFTVFSECKCKHVKIGFSVSNIRSSEIYGMIFIYRNWVSTWWQWSVNLYKTREETAIYKRRNNTQKKLKHRIPKIEDKHKRILKIIIRVDIFIIFHEFYSVSLKWRH
jgi:hypothetical protein